MNPNRASRRPAPPIDGLRLVGARREPSGISTVLPVRAVSAMVDAGTVVIVKDAVAPEGLRKFRAELHASQPAAPGSGHPVSGVSRHARHDDPAGAPIRGVFDSYFLDADGIDEQLHWRRALLDSLAGFWMALTNRSSEFLRGLDGKSPCPIAQHYPAGGGWFAWHEHPLEPTRVGMILSLSEEGVDFRHGATEFKTPFGLVSTQGFHDIGDICLFRYDLPHMVTPVDPEGEIRWDGTGRWTLILPVR